MKLFNVLIFSLFFLSIQAQYKETMNLNGLTKDLKKDYNLKDDNAKSDQSSKLTKAISDVYKKGGGVINIPKGVYCFGNIEMKSNVHILIEGETVIKPAKKHGVVFLFSSSPSESKKEPQFYIENTSVRGLNGAFTIDYHTRVRKDRQRAIILRMVKNFLIQDMIVKDNYSTFCGITLTPSNEKVKDVSGWKVSRPTSGTIKNITHYNASPGYGLVQCHGAQSVHFENLYCMGGVSFRLEVGAANKNVGVFDLTAKNIINEDGRCSVMINPHSAKCGKVTVDGVKAISSGWAVQIGDGHVKENAPDQTIGWFDSSSSIKNVTAVWGNTAQFRADQLLFFPNRDNYNDIKLWSDGKFMVGPCFGAVANSAKNYKINVEKVKLHGFPEGYENYAVISKKSLREGNKWKEKEAWGIDRKGAEWKLTKGVVVRDYVAKAYKF